MKNFSKVFFLFLMSLMFTFPTFASSTPDPNCPLDYFYRGYDLIKGNPASDGSDPGWRLSIMNEGAGKSCLTCDAYTSCSGEYIVHEMDAELDYYYSLYSKASVSSDSEDFLVSTSFTGSGEYYYQQEDVFGLGLVNVQAEANCQLYEGGRDLNCTNVHFTSGFKNAVAAFPTSTDDPDHPHWFEDVYHFFSDYGTHIIGSDASLGARWIYEAQFTQANYDALRAGEVNIAVAAEAEAEFYRTKGVSGNYETQEVKEMRLAFESALSTQRALFIGAPPPADLSFGNWANHIENPIPQKFNLTPISELFSPAFFPDDPEIEAKRKVMEAGYLLYCASVPSCHVPQPPKIVRVYDTEEGKYKMRNNVSVSCPEDYQLISGGCKSEPEPKEPYYWHLPSIKPQDNTYHCSAQMDYYYYSSEHNYYKGLDASATCLHNDYVKEKVIATCEGSVEAYFSECVAQCPAGFEVTGGGCESNLHEESQPWKVTRSSPIHHPDAHWSGWNCRVANDSYTYTYGRSAKGYAICVQYTEDAIEDQKIISENSGTKEKFTNGTNATCDVGYEVLGGGCIVPSDYYGAYEWKIVETLPSKTEQGWSCLGQENLYTYNYNQDVQTNAICVKFK